jgi:four helix bundle protein
MTSDQRGNREKSEKGGNSEKGVKGGAAAAFEELHVYQRARELTNAIYQLTRQGAFAADRGLVDQIRRAAASIMSNIAEGFERGSKTEFIQFLFIAKGSCGEVRAQLQIALDQHYVSGEEYNRLYNLARMTSGMLSNSSPICRQLNIRAKSSRGSSGSRLQRSRHEWSRCVQHKRRICDISHGES